MTPEPIHIFGRNEYLNRIDSLLSSDDCKVIILRGFGGIGKSTIAKKVAYEQKEKKAFDYIVWIDLNQFRNDELELHTIFNSFEFIFKANTSLTNEIDIHKKINKIFTAISEMQILIIFDNFECIKKMGDQEKTLCDFIMRLPWSRQNKIRVLITTRELTKQLDCIIDRNILIIEKIDIEAATQLIEKKIEALSFSPHERSNIVNKIEQIYDLCYGIPILLEMCISKLSYITLDAFARKLDQISAQTDTTDEIYDIFFSDLWESLTEEDKKILLTMTLFPEYAGEKALKEIADVHNNTTIPTLIKMSLFNRNYLEKYDIYIYTIHPLTQKVCKSQLNSTDYSDLKKAINFRFIAYYLNFLQENREASSLHTLLEFERTNLIAAIKISQENQEWELILRFRDHINQFLWKAGYWEDRLLVNQIMLDAAEKTKNNLLQADILVRDIGFIYLRFEDLQKAKTYVQAGLDLYKSLQHDKGIAQATRHLGKIALLKAEYEIQENNYGWEYFFKEGCEKLYKQSLNIWENLIKDDSEELLAIGDLYLDFGRLYWLWGRKYNRLIYEYNQTSYMDIMKKMYKKAIEESQKGIDRYTEYNNSHKEQKGLRGIAKAYGNMGNIRKSECISFLKNNRIKEALKILDMAYKNYLESLKIAETIKKTDEIAHAQWGLAEVYELYYDYKDMNNKNLIEALKYAENSKTKYKLMATPYDTFITTKLFERIKNKQSRHVQQDESSEFKFFLKRDAHVVTFLSSALQSGQHREIAILGVQLKVLDDRYEDFINCAEKGCTIKLLMMCPYDNNKNKLPWVDEIGKVNDFYGLYNFLKGNIDNLKHKISKEKREIQQRISIKLYRTIPTITMVLVDKDRDNGIIKAEALINGVSQNDRPSCIFTMENAPHLYKKFIQTFNNIWDDAIELHSL